MGTVTRDMSVHAGRSAIVRRGLLWPALRAVIRLWEMLSHAFTQAFVQGPLKTHSASSY